MSTSLTEPTSRPAEAEIHRYTTGSLIRDITGAVERYSGEAQVPAVREALVNAVKNHAGFLPARFFRTQTGKYARRPLYVDPDGRFSVVVMTWDKGQGTPLHDHGGTWVVECVYAGRMKVTDYAYLGVAGGLHQFEAVKTVEAHPGDAGYRTPPEEHHILENNQDEPSVTIHVFGNIFEQCAVFDRVDGGYVRHCKKMEYTVD